MKRWKCGISAVILLFIVTAIGAAQLPNPSETLPFEQQGKFGEAAEAWRAVTQRNP